MYEEVYNICRNLEGVMNMFSKELQILDQNTVKYMIAEMKDTIDEQQNIISEKDNTIDEQQNIISQKDNTISDLRQQLDEQNHTISQLLEKFALLEHK